MNKKLLAILLGVFALGHLVQADSFLELESSALGDGWFQYRLKVFNDAFFTRSDVTKITIPSLANRLDYATTPDWTHPVPDATDEAVWQYALPSFQDRPYERVFLFHSAYPAFCHTNKIILSYTITESSALGTNWTDAAGQTVYGYTKVFCIAPCPPEAADADPSTNLLSVVKLVPDLELRNITVSNGEPYGITYNWSYTSTVLLQGSMDFTNWTNVAYLLGNAGSTTWSTNQTLAPFGPYFRLKLITSGHTNLTATFP